MKKPNLLHLLCVEVDLELHELADYDYRILSHLDNPIFRRVISAVRRE